MDTKTKEMYSEVYSILGMMEEKYIKKLPRNLYNLIKENRLESYNPIYNPEEELKNYKIQKNTIAMLALLKLNYWCEDEEEKNEIKKILNKNSEEQSRIMREKYSSSNMFKHLNRESEEEKNKTELIVVEEKKEHFLEKILKKIQKLLRIKR